jgi:hypothetical protein
MVSAWKSIVNAAPDSIAETIHFPFRHELPPTFIIFVLAVVLQMN